MVKTDRQRAINYTRGTGNACFPYTRPETGSAHAGGYIGIVRSLLLGLDALLQRQIHVAWDLLSTLSHKHDIHSTAFDKQVNSTGWSTDTYMLIIFCSSFDH